MWRPVDTARAPSVPEAIAAELRPRKSVKSGERAVVVFTVVIFSSPQTEPKPEMMVEPPVEPPPQPPNKCAGANSLPALGFDCGFGFCHVCFVHNVFLRGGCGSAWSLARNRAL